MLDTMIILISSYGDYKVITSKKMFYNMDKSLYKQHFIIIDRLAYHVLVNLAKKHKINNPYKWAFNRYRLEGYEVQAV